jgi:uncharacterized protein (TIGR02266 family)
MTLIKTRYRSSDAFLEAYQQQFMHGGWFVATRVAHELGSAVVFDPRFPDLRSRVLVRGYIAWRRPARQVVEGSVTTRLRAGVGIELSAGERRKRDYLLAVARGDVVDLTQRRHRRLPVSLEISWRLRGERARFSSQLEDIGEGGAFVRTHEFLPVGSTVLLEVTPPGGAAPLSIEARVAWTHHTVGEEGMGVEFRCRDTGGARRLRELVRRIRDEIEGRVASLHSVG